MGVDPLSLALLTITLGTTGYSYRQQRRSAKAQERIRQAEINTAKTETRRRQMEQLARMRAFRAATLNVAEQTGVAGASTTAGTVGSITASAADNIARLSSNLRTNVYVAEQQQQASDALGKAALAEAVGSIANSVASATGAYDKLFQSKEVADTSVEASKEALSGLSDEWLSQDRSRYADLFER